ncbi:hypothetical protein IL306_012151 [Fusarium sp. DS 682]|nr:hypothetical protein IL306_012151 [Fusarium sp. DS 682]
MIQKEHLTRALQQLSRNRTCSSEISVHEMTLLVITDYLTKLLGHAKNEIPDRDSITSTEMVICVPVAWNQKALRDIQTCMTLALKRSNFPGVDFSDDSINNVFVIAEPEAAATWLLTKDSSIVEGDVFTILDAGGGTCDALTYDVTERQPLRLQRQLGPHSGDSCGSNALNDAFRQLLKTLLAEHAYLTKDGVTLQGYISKLASHDFETKIKARWVVPENNKDAAFEVIGLKFDPGNPGQMAEIMKMQVYAAEEMGSKVKVSKVFNLHWK